MNLVICTVLNKYTGPSPRPTPLARSRTIMFVIACFVAAMPFASLARAESRIGDAGHFLQFGSDVLASNPDGRAFTVTVHRHVWPADWGNGDEKHGVYTVNIFAPDGTRVVEGKIPSGQAKGVFEVPAGAKGVYKINWKNGGYGLTWVESSLDRMVAACGPWDMKGADGKENPYECFFLHVMAPRRWYFFVPKGVKTFEVKHTVMPFQSHREDYGFLVMNPRGQRVAAFYGGKPLEWETKRPNTPIPIVQTIETDEGTTGRFWSIWATGGDSHNFSDLNIMLNGVPAYFAPTPEQWFDPATGKAPEPEIYDESWVRVHDQKDASGKPISRDHYLLSPVTFLGDEDYNGWRGPQTIYMGNPENREIGLGVVTYVADNSARFPVKYRILAPNGKVAVEAVGEYGHHKSHRLTIPAAGAGVYKLDIDAARWFPWMEPTTPVVLAGKPIEGAGTRFEIETGIARHWFFKVPKGTKTFRVAATVKDPKHVLKLEVHAPDRIADEMYVRGGPRKEVSIEVPSGLDDKIWFVRVEVGSATEFWSDTGKPRQLSIEADIDLFDVPGFIAPTWEQWFDPRPK